MLFQSMLIALHLGAHKTATTYIQSALELSWPELDRVRVGYVPLKGVRSTLTERLGFGRRGLKAGVNALLLQHRFCKRLILSDENIVGGLKPSRSGFYAKRRTRLGKLLNELDQHDVHIYFAMRSYDEFISAMYCEYIRHHPFVAAKSYIRGFRHDAFSWAKIVETFVTMVGAENVTLWRHEDFPVVQEKVFAALTGTPESLIHKPVDRIRESLSAAAVQALTALEPAHDLKEIRARAKSVAAAHPKAPENPTFSAFDPATSELLRLRYEHDVSGLLEAYPDVHFLGRCGNVEPSARKISI